MKVAATRRMLVVSLLLLCLAAKGFALTPKGSLTIHRIADINYPTDHPWSPDSKTIAPIPRFLRLQNAAAVASYKLTLN